jgi:hypothetical protein
LLHISIYAIAPIYEKNGKHNVHTLTGKFEYIHTHVNLKKINFINEDVLANLDKYKDDPTVFIYCDPPYYAHSRASVFYNVANNVNVIEVLKDYFLTAKCKIMLNIDFCAYLLDHLGQYLKCFYPIKYNIPNKAGTKTSSVRYPAYHCLFTNY